MSNPHNEQTTGGGAGSLVDNRPIDTAGQSRWQRIIAPIWALVAFGWLIWVSADHAKAELIASASLVFAGAVVLLVRTRRPMHTWPAWLFSVKR